MFFANNYGTWVEVDTLSKVLKQNMKKRTRALFRSLGLMQRTKDGSQLNNIFIKTSRDLLNCALNVGERFLVSSP